MFLQVMIDFQAAEKKRLEEPASEIGLEPLCAMVSVIFFASVGLLFQRRIFYLFYKMTFNTTFYLD